MSLDALYHHLLAGVATATPATPATPEPDIGRSVATVVTVAVADVLKGGDEQAIRAWLAHINETDQGLIEAIIEKCRSSIAARQCYLEQAGKIPTPDTSKEASWRTVASVATVAVAKIPETESTTKHELQLLKAGELWKPAFDAHVNHIMTCKKCYAPKARYCSEGQSLYDSYNCIYKQQLEVSHRQITCNPERHTTKYLKPTMRNHNENHENYTD